jgi:hypothetical protein
MPKQLSPTSACDEPTQLASNETCERAIPECGRGSLSDQPPPSSRARMECLFQECFASPAANQLSDETIRSASASERSSDEGIARPWLFQERNR